MAIVHKQKSKTKANKPKKKVNARGRWRSAIPFTLLSECKLVQDRGNQNGAQWNSDRVTVLGQT